PPAADKTSPAEPSLTAPSTSTPRSASGSPSGLTLANVKVVDGQVAITDQQKQQPRAVYDHIDIDVSDFGAGKAFPASFAAHMPGAGAETISFKGKVGPLQENNFAATNFDGELKLDQLSFSGLQKFLGAAALSTFNFSATGTTHVSSSNGNVTSSGDLTLADGRVHGIEIGYPISMDYNIAADLAHDQYTIQKGSLKLGSTPLSVTGTMN